MVAIWTGTSGYNYPEWKGRFYPEAIGSDAMLGYYAGRFPTVEINYSFYRMPTERLLSGWAARVPERFTFTLKAPRRITHDRRLKDCGDPLRAFCAAAASLGPKLGILLFQLPPNFKCDLDVFDAFLHDLPPGARAAFEFRHASWLDEPVFERLRRRNLALCVADDGTREPPRVATADYGYVRLRDEGYDEAALAEWVGWLRSQPWREAFVYFKHEEEARGPELAQALMRLLQRAEPQPF